MKWLASILKERKQLRMILISIIVFLLGLILVYISTNISSQQMKVIVLELGSLFLITVSLSNLWELKAKSTFLDETWARAGLAHELLEARISNFELNFQNIPFQDLLENIYRLDILFSYAETWRNSYFRQLRIIAQSKGARIRVILPDPENSVVMQDLSNRFEQPIPKITGRIIEAKDFFLHELKKNVDNGAEIEVYYLTISPHHTFYIMDNIAVLAMYYYQKGRGFPVPTFMVEKGGELYKFVEDEMQDMIKGGGFARRIMD